MRRGGRLPPAPPGIPVHIGLMSGFGGLFGGFGVGHGLFGDGFFHGTDIDTGATKLRMALPKLILRGVSGAAFGKTFPVGKEMIIGRQHDCDIPIPAEEVSRHHVRIKPGAEGLLIEDLGSANGTYINGKRVQQGLLKPGDELRLDSIRFMLIAPGMEIPRGSDKPASTPAPAAASGGSKLPMIIGVLVVLAVIAGAVWYFALR